MELCVGVGTGDGGDSSPSGSGVMSDLLCFFFFMYAGIAAGHRHGVISITTSSVTNRSLVDKTARTTAAAAVHGPT